MKKAFREVSFLWVGTLLGALAAFFTQVILARELGPNNFGIFASAIAVVALLTPVAGFGVAQYWLKVFGEEGVLAKRWLKGSFQLIAISTSAILILIFLWSLIINKNSVLSFVYISLSIFLLSQIIIEFLSVRFQLEERYFLLALTQLVPHLLRLLLVLLISLSAWVKITPESSSFVYFFVGAVILLMGRKSFIEMIRGNIKLKGHAPVDESIVATSTPPNRPSFYVVLGNCWPFGLATFFYLIYYQSNIVILQVLVGNEAAGIYNVAFTVMAAVYLLPGVIYQKYLMPKIHRWANHDANKFHEVYKLGIKSMLILGIVAMLGIWMASFWAIPFLFGDAYAKSIDVINILALSAPIIFLAFNSGAALVTKENMLRKVKYMGLVAVINLALNLALIPNFGIIGSAFASLISNSILLYLYTTGAKKYVFYRQ